MISFWRQLRFLLWKNILIKKRQKFWLAVELLVPIILFAILALVRTKDFVEFRTQCHYDAKAFPSAGLLPFVHSFFCFFPNQCHLSPTSDDDIQVVSNDTDTSILTDVLYYTRSQLEDIQVNSAAYDKLFSTFGQIIEDAADIPLENLYFTPNQFYPNNRKHEEALIKMGADAPAVQTLLSATITPKALLEAWNYAQEVNNLDLLSIFTFDTKLPFLCDPVIFNSTFLWKDIKNITVEQQKTLCNITIFKLSQATDLQTELVFPPAQLYKGNNNIAKNLSDLLNNLKDVVQTIKTLPIAQLGSKYSNITWDLMHIFNCQVNPFDIAKNGLFPSTTGGETPFDRMKKQLIQFLEHVVPGQDKKHDRQFCNKVPIRKETNCTLWNNAAVKRLKPILQGYILVTPKSPLTEKIVDMLNLPLKYLEYIKKLLLSYPGISSSIQQKAYESKFRLILQKLSTVLRNLQTYPVDPILAKTELFLDKLLDKQTHPNTFSNITNGIIEKINEYSSCFLIDRFIFVESEQDMEESATCLMDFDQYFTGLVFLNTTNQTTSFGPFTSYKIRHHPEYVDSTDGIADSAKRAFSRDKPFLDLKYLTYGFVFIQEAVDRAIIRISSNKSIHIGVYSQQEPYPCQAKDNFNVSNFLGLFVILSFLIPASLLVKNIVFEKEHRLKEQMRIMGLGDTVHFISWAIVSIVLNMLSVLIISLILKFGRIFENCEFTLLLTFLSLFALSSIALSLLFSTFFTNANISTAATCIIYFLFFFPFQLSVKSKNRLFSQFTLIFPQTTLGYGSLMMATSNDLSEATWATIDKMYLSAYDVSMVQCMVAFAIQTVVFCILAWYISAIAPGVYGVSQPWYFPVTRQYWFPTTNSADDDLIESNNFDSIPAGGNFEAEPVDLNMRVHIKDMSKIYSNGTKALNKLNLRLYENNITSLLGHNGAGKTTTMSMLCGLYSPSSGTCSIYGNDIRKNMRSVRDVLGVCPQHNVLFSLLTVKEQLRFFAALKGCPSSELKDEVEKVIKSVKLEEKSDCLAETLSGGMKRRLCIAIALVGKSKFVILDEPTAGVDVNSRKDIWKLLQENKLGRTILLSTHHMDEADVLSDRVAVLSEGELVTLGSPVFLKTRYGENMELVVCKKNQSSSTSKERAKQIIGISDLDIKLKDETEDEMTFTIPLSTDSKHLESFFHLLDERLQALSISDYGISAPTLYQIFIKLAPNKAYKVPKVRRHFWTSIKKIICCRSPTVDTENTVLLTDTVGSTGIPVPDSPNPIFEEDCDFNFPFTPVSGWHRSLEHFRALFISRAQYTWRSRKSVLFQIILPILLLMSCELYAKLTMGNSLSTSMVISQNPLPLVNGLFGNNSDTYVNVLERNKTTYGFGIMNSILHSPGLGTRCSVNQPELFEGIGCAKGYAQGNFKWDNDGHNSSYNQDLICVCNSSNIPCTWNCTMEDYPLWSLDYLYLNTTDRIWDMSYRNISQMRMDSRISQNTSTEAPYFLGGFSFGHENHRSRKAEKVGNELDGYNRLTQHLLNLSMDSDFHIDQHNLYSPLMDDPFIQNITFQSFLDYLFNNLDVKENTKVWFNNKAWPSLPIYISNFYNALLRSVDSKYDPEQLGILTFNHPMNETVQNTFDNTAIQKVIVFRIVIIVLVLSLIPAGFTVFLVQDRVSDSYHLQIVSGLKRKTYWLTGFLFDMIVYTIAILVIILAYAAFGVKELTYNTSTASSFFLLFLVYGLTAVLWAYVLQRWFDIPALSFVMIAVGSFFVGIVCSMTVIIIEQMMKTDPTLETDHKILSIVFLLIPQYNLGMAIFRGSYVYQLVQMGEKYLIDINRPDLIKSLPLPNIMEWDLMGEHCAALLCHMIIAALVLALLELNGHGFLRKKEKKRTVRLLEEDDKREDDDVLAEKQSVENLSSTSCSPPLVVKDLAKSYSSSTLAVKGVSFMVNKGECFGLLGLNGAGKTTTFGMLTRKILSGHGTVMINGAEVTSGDISGYSQLGYCPQFDALNIQLTTRQNLVFYSRIRGVPEGMIPKLTTRLMRSLHLQSYADVNTGELSGGNKRKLSVAIALISQPSVILLDEPSAGMDPGSQQFLWKIIEKLRRNGTAVVITSHSMEECEALCTRIAIMDRGKVRCLGSKQHLKNKFGSGYSLTLKMRNSSDTTCVASRIQELLPSAYLGSIFCSTIFFQIHRDSSTIANILHIVNIIKEEYKLEDFSLSQSTLEEVFYSLATREWAPLPLPPSKILQVKE